MPHGENSWGKVAMDSKLIFVSWSWWSSSFHYHQEVDVLCLIQCSSPFIQPDFLESGYKLILQVNLVIIIIITLAIIILITIIIMTFLSPSTSSFFWSSFSSTTWPATSSSSSSSPSSIHHHHRRVMTQCSQRHDAKNCVGRKWTLLGEFLLCQELLWTLSLIQPTDFFDFHTA